MTDSNLNIFTRNKWYPFWKNLKEGYDNFERTKIPPRVNVCGKRYLIENAGPDEIKQLKPMRKLHMVKLGKRAKDDDRCFQQPPAAVATRKIGVRHASTARVGAKF